jgi:transcriptional regulator with XRE-family HTH domain
MRITKQIADQGVLEELGYRLARARLERNLTQARVAEEAGVSKRTVERLESGDVSTQLSSFVRVCRALDLLERFDALIPEPMASPIAQLKRRGKVRRRASAIKGPGTASTPWSWSDKR